MPMRHWVLRTGSLALTTFATGAHAAPVDEAPVALSYHSRNGCGDRASVLTRLRELLGAAEPPAVDVEATIGVDLVNGAYEVRFQALRDGAPSQRQLVVADCTAAVEASALLLLLTIDPLLASDQLSEPEAATPTPQTASPRDATEPSAQQARASTNTLSAAAPVRPLERTTDAVESAPQPLSRGIWVGLGAETVTSLGPRWALGASAGAGFNIGVWGLHVQGAYDPVPEAELAAIPGATIRSNLLRLQLHTGPLLRSHVLSGGPLIGVGLEHLSAEVAGISSPAPGASTWLSLTAGGVLGVRLWGNLNLRLQAGAVYSVQRPTFTVKGLPDLIHRPQALGFYGCGGLSWAWDNI